MTLSDLSTRAWAFVLRDFRENASYRLAFAFQIYGIFFSVTLFFFIARIFGAAAAPSLSRYGSEYFPYVLIGLAFMGFMTTGMGVFAGSIRQGQVTGTLEAMLVTPTPLAVIVMSSALWAFVRSALNVALFLIVGAAFGIDLSHASWLAATAILGLSVTAFSGLGMLSAAFVLAFKRGNPVSAVMGATSGLLAGVYFPIDLLPDWLYPITQLIPLTHALEGMRRAVLVGDGFRELSPELGVLALFTAVFVPLGLAAFRLAVRHAKKEGSLAHY